MYEWLTDGLRDESQVVTLNRRLARVLTAHYCQQQLDLGHSAWRSPAIRSWQDWLADVYAAAELSAPLPARINAHQSSVLWERCLRREIADPLLNMPMLVRQARESWARLHEFAVPLSECEASARGRDQNIFARAAGGYQFILESEHWVDEAGLAGKVAGLISCASVALSGGLTLAGFDRISPQVEMVLDALRTSGVHVNTAPRRSVSGSVTVRRYDNSDAELRGAGAWARKELQESPDQVVGIIATHLDQDSERCGRMVREGLAPGWQFAGARYAATVNVSYGSSLSQYPAIAIALLALRWLRDDLPGRDVSMLLRSPAIATSSTGGRGRLELMLRGYPDRGWSPAMLLGQLSDLDDSPDAADWLQRLSAIDEMRARLPRRAAPSEWVVLIDDLLGKLNWPGERPLDSHEFQLINRWRELLNDFARLQLVSPAMAFAEALRRLTTMAGETVFQPESDGAIVQLLGPLEAAGMEFDRLWISGLSSTNWPPPGRPSSLLSRELQRRYRMPDADPDNTLDFARRVLTRLVAAADQVAGSFPLTDGDAEQSASGLLDNLPVHFEKNGDDPGWHAAELVNITSVAWFARDPVPPVLDDESITGGATTVNYQFHEPFSAFCFGRLAVRPLMAITNGLSASLRGSLIHDALRRLYAEGPSQADIVSWDEQSRRERIDAALRNAFMKHERYADHVLRALLRLEQRRDARLLHDVVELETGRRTFKILEVEASLDAVLDGIRLGLRIDRIDQLASGELVIVDYKTGARKAFRSRDGIPNDMQLVVYSCAVKEPVAGLGLINIDSRSIDFDGAGTEFTPDLDWQQTLAGWQHEVHDALRDIQRGDVRINSLLDRRASRSLSLLSRIAELRRDV